MLALDEALWPANTVTSNPKQAPTISEDDVFSVWGPSDTVLATNGRQSRLLALAKQPRYWNCICMHVGTTQDLESEELFVIFGDQFRTYFGSDSCDSQSC